MIENPALSLFPQPHDEDDGDVAWALQTAQVQWTRGLQNDALIWLRRAVESAIDNGAAERAAEINRAANQLSELIVRKASSSGPPLPSFAMPDPISSPDDLLDAVDDDDVSQDEMEKHVRVSDLGEIGNALVALSSNVDSLRAQQRSSKVPSNAEQPPSNDLDSFLSDIASGHESQVPASDSELPTLPPPPRKPQRLGALGGEFREPAAVLPPTSARIAESLAETLEAEDFRTALTSEVPSQPEMDAYESIPPGSTAGKGPAAPPPPPSSRSRVSRSSLSSNRTSRLPSRGPSLLSSFPSRSQLDAEKAKALAGTPAPTGKLSASEAPEVDARPGVSQRPEPMPGPTSSAPASVTPAPAASVPAAGPSSPEAPSSSMSASPSATLPQQVAASLQVPKLRSRSPVRKGPSLRDKLTERDIELLDVQGFQDLPEDALDELTEKGRVEILDSGDELSNFGVVLVLHGSVGIMPAIADAECAKAEAGEVVFTAGSLQDGVALRVVAAQDGAELAVWDSDVINDKFAACPWVIDELMEAADRHQALAGVAMGPMGERLDDALRRMVTDRCEVIALDAGELLIGQGKVVGGMHVVGAGRVELLKPGSDEVEEELGPGDFLFPDQVLASGTAPRSARAGKGGAVVLFADRGAAHELLVSVPPLLEILASART